MNESLHILIQNRTDNVLYVSLYPNDKYILPKYGFVANDMGSTGGRDTKYTLHPNNGNTFEWDERIFRTSDLNIEPYTLAMKVFDSIYIGTANEDSVIIKFTHENVIGYSENIFSENSTWEFQIREDNLQTEFRRNPQKYYEYTFLILKDKIVSNE